MTKKNSKGKIHIVEKGSFVEITYPDIAVTRDIMMVLGVAIIDPRGGKPEDRVGYLGHFESMKYDYNTLLGHILKKTPANPKALEVVLAGEHPSSREHVELGIVAHGELMPGSVEYHVQQFKKKFNKYREGIVLILTMNGVPIDNITTHLAKAPYDPPYKMTLDLGKGNIEVEEDK